MNTDADRKTVLTPTEATQARRTNLIYVLVTSLILAAIAGAIVTFYYFPMS